MDVYWVCLLLLTFIINAVWAFWRGTDDSGWETRWRALDDLDRAWLAAASRSSANRTTLEERGEFELAKGFGRRELRRRSRIALSLLSPFLIVAALMLTGLLEDRFAIAFLSSFTFLQAIVAYRRERQIKARYREVQDTYLATAGATNDQSREIAAS